MRSRRSRRPTPRVERGSLAFPRRLARLVAVAWLLATPAAAERLPFTTFTTADGLAGDAVRDLLVDSRGFVWVGTTSGLSRFDGASFRTYEREDGLPSPRVDGVVETRDGGLWFVTDAGVARLDPRPLAGQPPLVPVSLPEGLSDAEVTGLAEDRAGRLWLTVGGRLYTGGDSTGSLDGLREVPLPEGGLGVGLVACDSTGGVWTTDEQGPLRRLPDGSWRRYPVKPPVLGVRALRVDSLDRVWIGMGDGLHVFWPEPASAPAPGEALHARARRPEHPGDLPRAPGDVVVYDAATGWPDPFVYHLGQAAGGAVWVATRAGAWRFADGGLRHFVAAQGLPEQAVTVVAEAPDGTWWAGTESRGLARLEPSGLVAYGGADGLVHERITSVFEDSRGELYVVGFSRDLHHFDGERFTRVNPEALARHGSTWGWNETFLSDRDGSWWLPTASGLFRFPPVARPGDLRQAVPDLHLHAGAPADRALPGDDVFRVYEDAAGDLWLSLFAEPPLVRLPRGERRPVPVPGVGDRRRGSPSAFAEDAEGNLWVGFYKGGLARRRAGRWTFYGQAEGAPPTLVSDLHRDRAGRLWVATQSAGIARVDAPGSDSPRFVRFGRADGLATDSARCLADGPDGRLYVGTARGVDRLDPTTGSVEPFADARTLPNGFVRTCFADRHGRLWFGTLHGLARVDPGVAPRRPALVVLLAGLRAGGVAHPLPELGAPEVRGWVLPPGRDDLEVDYFALGGGPGVRFQHQLEGRDAGWSVPSASRRLDFAELAPGRYRLLVRAVAADGTVGPRPAVVEVELLAPVWRRGWFVAAAALALAAAAWAAYRLRVRRLLAMEQVRTRIAADLHDEVGASLARIRLLGELARAQLPAADEGPAAMLGRIGEEAAELTTATSDMAWALDAREDDLGSLLARLRRFAADLLETRGIRLQVAAPEDAGAVALGPEVRRALHLALKEALHNVARHSRARNAWLSLAVRGGEVHAEVRDDGVGIAPGAAEAAAASGRRGLRGLRERARSAGGRAAIETPAEGGTRVTLAIPLAAGGLRSRLRRVLARARPRTGMRGPAAAPVISRDS